MRPQYHHKQYANLEIFKEAVDNLLANIPEDGGVIHLQPLFFQLTLDTTTAFLFGESVHSFKAPSSATADDDFGKYFNIAQDYVAKRFRLSDLYWLIGGKKFLDACRRVHQFADKIIDRNLSLNECSGSKEDKYVFLRTLAEDTPDRAAIRGQVINILVAGRDTTASLISWVL